MIRLSLFFTLLTLSAWGQSAASVDSLIQEAQLEFQKTFAEQDFERSIELLEYALRLDKENPKALYYLGYAYSRFNCPDARGIPTMRVDLCLKSSEALEQIPSLSRVFNDNPNMQLPKDKLTSEWGAMAMSYALAGKQDSSDWALREGAKRGGFDEAAQSVNEQFLDALPAQSLVFISGDYFTFNLLYLQQLKKKRPDVRLVNVSLLNTLWYPELLTQQGIDFGLEKEALNSLNYELWKDSILEVSGLRWTVPPSYANAYLLRGDLLMLELLKKNIDHSPICFSLGFPRNGQVGLEEYLSHSPFFDYIENVEVNASFEHFKAQLQRLLNLQQHLSSRGSGYPYFLRGIFNTIDRAYEEAIEGEIENAQSLVQLLDEHLSSEIPAEVEAMLDRLRESLAGK